MQGQHSGWNCLFRPDEESVTSPTVPVALLQQGPMPVSSPVRNWKRELESENPMSYRTHVVLELGWWVDVILRDDIPGRASLPASQQTDHTETDLCSVETKPEQSSVPSQVVNRQVMEWVAHLVVPVKFQTSGSQSPSVRVSRLTDSLTRV